MQRKLKIILGLFSIIVIAAVLIIYAYKNRIEGLTVINSSGEFDPEAESKANFTILLTNQSFYKPEIKLTVYVDRVKLINQVCKVEDQHKSYNYYYELIGSHQLIVTSEDGMKVIEDIVIDTDKPTWHMFTYWKDETEEGNLDYRLMEHPFWWE